MHIVFILYVWPEPDSSAAGYRTLSLIESFIDQGWHINLISAAEQTELSAELSHPLVKCHQTRLNHSDFDRLIEKIKMDVVIYDRFILEEQFSWRVEQFHPQALKILDTCDLHFLRRARETALKNSTTPDLNSEDCIREISSIYRCDISLIISDYEYQLLTTNFQIDSHLLYYLPFMFKKYPISPVTFKQRKNFFMIGNFLHKPNKDAVLWCIKEIWPGIKKRLSSAELHIYGAYMPEHIQQHHHAANGILIKGRAFELNDLLQNYRINLAPLRFGAGIKGKIADGFIAGTPTITTSIGAEGICPKNQFGGIVADSADEIATSAISLYKDEVLWKHYQQKAYQCIESRHDYTKNKKKLIDVIKNTLNDLKQHRKNNFIGNMLQYHLHQSRKYLSRWIELKNRQKND